MTNDYEQVACLFDDFGGNQGCAEVFPAKVEGNDTESIFSEADNSYSVDEEIIVVIMISPQWSVKQNLCQGLTTLKHYLSSFL